MTTPEIFYHVDPTEPEKVGIGKFNFAKVELEIPPGVILEHLHEAEHAYQEQKIRYNQARSIAEHTRKQMARMPGGKGNPIFIIWLARENRRATSLRDAMEKSEQTMRRLQTLAAYQRSLRPELDNLELQQTV